MGCGSIGSRRAKILAGLGLGVELYDVDERRAFDLLTAIGGVAHVGTPLGTALELSKPEAVVVCTPAEGRLGVVDEILRNCPGLRGLYVEKPLALDAAHARAIAHLARRVPVTMGACNMRFDVRLGPVGPDGAWESAVLCMGQAARHWSPTHQPLPMALDSIHELDLAAWLLGPIRNVAGQSTLDWADLLTAHSAAYAHIHLDRKLDPPQRYLEVTGGPMSYRAELWPPDPQMYLREMAYFVRHVEEGRDTWNPLAEAAEVTAAALEVCA